MEETMNKKLIVCILSLALALCLFAGCEKSSAADNSAPAASPGISDPVQNPDSDSPLPPQVELSPEPEPESTATPDPDPEPEITPPADEPTDPSSGTDVIYESETLPPYPASDTDLEP